MAPKPITEPEPVGQDTALPPEIIAQAEAAVAGNTPMSKRRPSQTNPSYSRQQQDLHQLSDSSEQPGLTSETQNVNDELVS